MPTKTGLLLDLEPLLPRLPSGNIGDASGALPLLQVPIVRSFSTTIWNKVGLVVSAGGTLWLQPLTADGPSDPDGILATAGAQTSRGALPPQIVAAKTDAWLKYGIEARVNTQASSGAGWFGGFGGQTGASGTVACFDYRRHPKNRALSAAVAEDLAGAPRLVLSLDDVKALRPGDALAVQVSGELSTKVSLTWSDVFTSQVGTLTRAVATSSPIGITLDAGATVTAAVTLADVFLLVCSRKDETHWRVGLKKGSVHAVDFGAKVGITVGFDEPDQITSVVGRVLDDLLGERYQDLRALVQRASIAEKEARRFAEAFLRLDLPEMPTPSRLQEALDRYERSVRDRIEKVVKEKVSLAFAYEYRRISSETTIFQALLTRDAVEQHHGSLARGSLDSVVEASLAAAPAGRGGVSLEHYLNERTVKTVRAFGFTLGIGKWKVSGKSRRELTRVRRMTIDEEHEQRSYAGFGAYSDRWFGAARDWQVDFVAEMPSFSTGSVPRLNEYLLGLAISYGETNKTFRKNDVDQAVDFAVLWAVCEPHQSGSVADLLDPFRDKKNVEWSINLRINDEAFRRIVAVVASLDRAQFAGAMAAALRTVGDLGIRDVPRRRRLYEPVWAFYLRERHPPTLRAIADAAARRLHEEAPSMAEWERRFTAVDSLVTMAGTCERNHETRADVDDFIRGTREIANAIERNGEDANVLSSAYGKMRKLWNQSHHVRSLGARFVEVAEEVGALKGVERTLTVTADGTSTIVSSNVVE